MSDIKTNDLERVTNFGSLVALLRDKLDWPLDEEGDFEDITFDWDADELGLKEEEVAKVREIHQLRPLTTGQPWGVFFISFEEKAVSVTVLRRMLRALVVKKRAGSQSSDRQAWQQNDLIFVTNFGASGAREIAFAHFSDTGGAGGLPALRVLGWNALDTRLHNTYVAETLSSRLRWPEDPEDHDKWRSEWRGAFELEHRQVVRTSQELARALADLAANIRARANELLEAETEQGNLRKMLAAFRKNLIHDLDEDGFADMFAQTISYGLLASYISRPKGEATPDSLVEMIPSTNPFLRELFSTFLSLGGQDKRQAMDFDELGVRDVVELLENANLEAVLRDFGDRNPKEDPVIHFYELFLKEYDPAKRMQRGVFYTPRPVVNFIVRGVDEILRKEFDLPLGLADTTTWGELAARNDKIIVPDHIDPDEPFVQILDPATGTGTFLVEVIDLIYERMVGLWRSEGRSTADIAAAWNEYVPAELLPRMTAFELMMAPYSIAHLKIGLKLRETGYRFEASARARVFLTNALEPARDLDMEFVFMAEALAHEAQAANDAKNANFTIVVGNPPYSPSMSEPQEVLDLLEDWKKGLNETKSDLNREEWKFLRMATELLSRSSAGCLGIIVNRDYLDGITKRMMRRWLWENFPKQTHIDLNGDVKGNISDENVFEIQQGVSICIISTAAGTVEYCSLVGTKEEKYSDLLAPKSHLTTLTDVNLKPPYFRISGTSEDTTIEEEYMSYVPLPSIFPSYSSGIQTKCDALSIHFSEKEIWEVVEDLSDLEPEEARQKYSLGKDGRDWTIKGAISDLNNPMLDRDNCTPIQYKPFDRRWTYWTGKTKGFLAYPRRDIMSHVVALDNLGFVFNRQVVGDFSHFFVSDIATNHGTFYLGNKGQDYLAPLWLIEKTTGSKSPNISSNFAVSVSDKTRLHFVETERGDLSNSFGVRDLFDYLYAVSYSSTYRSRYGELLKSDFPRLPLPKDLTIFQTLAPLGRGLVSLHLLRTEEAEVLNSLEVRLAGSGEARVEKGYPKFENGKVMINDSRWFEDVPRETWEYRVGGYQVCEKWLKDRAGKGGKKASPGRVLSEEDICHYRRVVLALGETRHIVKEIDRAIEANGGWLDAFFLPAPPPPSVEDIIEADESRELEFKSTFQWDTREDKQNKSLQKQVLKTLAAFMNTEGGTLVIGVTDDKEIIGLEHDLKLVKGSLDAFENRLLSVFASAIGAPYSLHCKLRFADAPDGKKVCVIDVAASKEPVFVDFQGQHEFFIRRGNATVSLNASDQYAYTRERF